MEDIEATQDESLADRLLKKANPPKKAEPEYNAQNPNQYHLSQFAGADKRKEPRDDEDQYWTGGRRERVGEETELDGLFDKE
jgi:hypothetical protein